MEVFSNKVARSTFGACTPRNILSRARVCDYMINFSNFSHLSSTLLTLTLALSYIYKILVAAFYARRLCVRYVSV